MLIEQGQRHGIAHGAIAGRIGMERIAAIISGPQPIGASGIAGGAVEIDQPVEMARPAYPGIDRLPVRFILGIGMIIIIADEGHDGGADHLDPARMGASDDLAIGADDAGDMGLVILDTDRRLAGQCAKIIDPFQQDQMGDAGLGQHIAVEPGQRIGAKPVVQQPVAADPLIDDGDVAPLGIGLQPLGDFQPLVGVDIPAVFGGRRFR